MRSEAAFLGASPESVRVLSGGVDTTFFSPGDAQLPPWAAGRRPVVLSARRLVPGKGVLELVQAMPQVVAEIPEALLVVAGNGSERETIEEFVARHNLTRSIRLLGDIGGAELVSWYRRADLAVTPTRRPEPFGLSTVEALSCGTPVVVTPIGANAKLVSGLHPSLVAQGSTSKDIAAAMLQLMAVPNLLHSVAARARAHVHARFSWDAVASQRADVYHQESARHQVLDG
jgi:glycosyltransferase involved in cell wall biosynthesis